MCRSCAPHFQFLENFVFSALFWPKFQRSRLKIFQIFVPKTPYFSRKIRSLDPTFGNPCGTYRPKKSWVPPPPGACGPACGILSRNYTWYFRFPMCKNLFSDRVFYVTIICWWHRKYKVSLFEKYLDNKNLNKIVPRKIVWSVQNFERYFWQSVNGELRRAPNSKLAWFVIYLKTINISLKKNNICVL